MSRCDFAHTATAVTEAPASQTITGGPATGFGPSTTVIPPHGGRTSSRLPAVVAGTQQ